MNLFVPELSWTGENFANVQLTTRFMTSSSLLHLKASSILPQRLAGLSTEHKGSIHLLLWRNVFITYMVNFS